MSQTVSVIFMFRPAAETADVLCKSCMCQYFVGSFVVAFQLSYC